MDDARIWQIKTVDTVVHARMLMTSQRRDGDDNDHLP